MNEQQHVSAFDLDGTLVKGNSSYHFCKYLSRKGVLPFYSVPLSAFYYARHYFLGMPLSKIHQKIFNNLLLGRSLKDLEKHIEGFLEEYLPRSLYFPAVNSLRLAQHLGHYTVILSNSPSFLVAPLARFFGVDEWKATEYAVDKDQKLCHISSILQSTEKAHYLGEVAQRLGIEKTQIATYSDSYLDLSFLLSGGCPIAVNPDKKLRQFSEKHNWSIL